MLKVLILIGGLLIASFPSHAITGLPAIFVEFSAEGDLLPSSITTIDKWVQSLREGTCTEIGTTLSVASWNVTERARSTLKDLFLEKGLQTTCIKYGDETRRVPEKRGSPFSLTLSPYLEEKWVKDTEDRYRSEFMPLFVKVINDMAEISDCLPLYTSSRSATFSCPNNPSFHTSLTVTFEQYVGNMLFFEFSWNDESDVSNAALVKNMLQHVLDQFNITNPQQHLSNFFARAPIESSVPPHVMMRGTGVVIFTIDPVDIRIFSFQWKLE